MQQIFIKYLNNQCSPEEIGQLMSHFNNPGNELILRELINGSLNDEVGISNEQEQWQEVAHQTYAGIRKLISSEGAKVIPLQKRLWFKIAAAAIVIMMLGTTYYLVSRSGSKIDIAKNTSQQKDIAAPVSSKAKITLSDGSIITLDSLQAGTLATQGNVKVNKTADGQIVYSGATSETAFNTLTNPRGSTVVNLTLNDGTKVWLNSESSLKYPVAFTGNERKVEITGEAYFEVAKDAHKKFLVDANGVVTEVLGTHFNVNSYADEASIKITLLEGAVKVTKGNLIGLLKPGQQAQVESSINVINDVNTEEVMAWKDGKFDFGEKADIASIMRQVRRWYDVEVDYKGNITQHFWGSISRDVNVSKVLKMLEATGGVTFKIDGNKIIAMP